MVDCVAVLSNSVTFFNFRCAKLYEVQKLMTTS